MPDDGFHTHRDPGVDHRTGPQYRTGADRGRRSRTRIDTGARRNRVRVGPRSRDPRPGPRAKFGTLVHHSERTDIAVLTQHNRPDLTHLPPGHRFTTVRVATGSAALTPGTRLIGRVEGVLHGLRSAPTTLTQSQ